MAYDPTADKKQYVLTDMLDNIEGGASNTMKFLNEKMADDPDRWDDDVWRFMGQRIGGALIGGGVGSFGGPKGTVGGAIVGGVIGFDNSAKLLGNIPGMRQLGRFQDATADGARYINEKLTPWLDPRVAGWGSRVVTDYLLERGVRSGVGKVKAIGSEYSKLASMSPVERSLSTGTVGAMQTPPTTKYQLLKAALKAQIAPRTKITSLEKARLGIEADNFQGGRTGVTEGEKIPLNKYTYASQDNSREIIDNVIQPYPRQDINELFTEEIPFDAEGIGQLQVFIKPEVAQRLKKLYNATDDEIIRFLEYEYHYITNFKESIYEENLLNFYKQTGQTRPPASIKRLIDEDYITTRLGNISIWGWIDPATGIWESGKDAIPWYKDTGHIRSVKNQWRKGDLGAERASNIRAENAWNYIDQRGRKRLGNRPRQDKNDLPSLIDQMRGVSRTIDEEFIKFRHPELQMMLDDLIPPSLHDDFVEGMFDFFDQKRQAGIGVFEDFVEEVYGISETELIKLTKTSKKKLLRAWKKQLDWLIPEQTIQHYPLWVREYIDEYILNAPYLLKVQGALGRLPPRN